jgi:hypothetical protein
VDERNLAKEHIGAFTDRLLDFGERMPTILFDCGYPSKDLIKCLQEKEIKYVMRVLLFLDIGWMGGGD